MKIGIFSPPNKGGLGEPSKMGRSSKRCASPVAGQACLVVADGPELLCGLHLAALPQKLSSEKYNEPSCSEAGGSACGGKCGQVEPAKERRHSAIRPADQ